MPGRAGFSAQNALTANCFNVATVLIRIVFKISTLTIVITDEPVPDEVIAALKKNPAITSAKRASL